MHGAWLPTIKYLALNIAQAGVADSVLHNICHCTQQQALLFSENTNSVNFHGQQVSNNVQQINSTKCSWATFRA